MRSTSRVTAQYMRHLLLVDQSLEESLAGSYPAERGRDRLRLALFMEYAAEQRLGPGEVAMLMGSGWKLLDAALSVLVDVATGKAAHRVDLARKLQTVTPARRRRER